MIVLSVLLSLIFLILSIIHLNWAIGNRWGYNEALPTNEDGKPLFRPGTFSCLVVALGLLIFAFFYFINPEPDNPKNFIFDWGRIIIPCIFLMRAIGDFKYVGLFKKVKSTNFARLDSKYFTPLCLFLSLAGFLIKYV